jgi:hypothetical protein
MSKQHTRKTRHQGIRDTHTAEGNLLMQKYETFILEKSNICTMNFNYRIAATLRTPETDCFRHIIVNILHEDNNNNNNNKPFPQLTFTLYLIA